MEILSDIFEVSCLGKTMLCSFFLFKGFDFLFELDLSLIFYFVLRKSTGCGFGCREFFGYFFDLFFHSLKERTMPSLGSSILAVHDKKNKCILATYII